MNKTSLIVTVAILIVMVFVAIKVFTNKTPVVEYVPQISPIASEPVPFFPCTGNKCP